MSLSAVMIPLFAAATRATFRRSRLNYAEHLVLALYTGAQQIALLVLLAGAMSAARVRGFDGVWLAAGLAYQVWAQRDFTGESVPQAAWRTLTAALLALLLGGVLSGVAAIALEPLA